MEITVNVTGLDNLANAIFALAKTAGNCKEETQVDATKVTPVVQQTVAPAETAAQTTTTDRAHHQYRMYSQYQQHRPHKRYLWHLQLVQCQQLQQPLHIRWNS